MDTEFFQAWVKSIIQMHASICFELWDATHNFIFTLMREISFQRHSFHPQKWKSLSKTLTLLSAATLNLVTSIWKVAEFRGLLCRACLNVFCSNCESGLSSTCPANKHTARWEIKKTKQKSRSLYKKRISLLDFFDKNLVFVLKLTNATIKLLSINVVLFNLSC